MKWNHIHQSPTVRAVVATLGVIVILLIVFKAGETYGYHRARFSQRYGDNFHQLFVGPRDGMGNRGWFMGGDIPGGHGATGKVVSVALPNITVAGPDNLEKIVVIGKDTLIRKFNNSASASDITAGDYVVALGDPNDKGEIEARLIRILPPPPAQPAAAPAAPSLKQ